MELNQVEYTGAPRSIAEDCLDWNYGPRAARSMAQSLDAFCVLGSNEIIKANVRTVRIRRDEVFDVLA